MRKVSLLAVAIVLSLLAVVPTFAQDTQPTIADIVVQSASAETPEFATLLAAVQAADPAVLEALSNADGDPLTVFAPTDAAFAAVQEALGEEAFNAVLADPAALTNILLYHVVPGAVKSADVVGLLEAAGEDGQVTVKTLQGQHIDISQDEAGDIYIDDAKLNLEMVDIEASNGVIHVIDSVMMPETRTIADIVVESAGMTDAPEFTTLLTAVQAADPAVLETLSNPDAVLTVFAPTDAAFAALPADTLNAALADQAMLTNILLYHVHVSEAMGDMAAAPVAYADVAAALTADGAPAEGITVPTALEGQSLTISLDEDGNPVINGSVKIVVHDIDAANGIIHVIDAVLLPPM
ncbi:MAG: fasciclin domain-containing protein [Chloroflexi bacterium]|nr:fasciclin domain-containing protein [Chloroflexota bacterium]